MVRRKRQGPITADNGHPLATAVIACECAARGVPIIIQADVDIAREYRAREIEHLSALGKMTKRENTYNVCIPTGEDTEANPTKEDVAQIMTNAANETIEPALSSAAEISAEYMDCICRAGRYMRVVEDCGE